MKKLFSALIASLLLCTSVLGTTVSAYANEDSDSTRSPLHFSEMFHGHYEATTLYDALEELEKLLEEEKQDERIVELYDTIFKELDMIFTASAINQIIYNGDVTNEQSAKEDTYYSAITLEAYDKVYSTLKKALASPYRDCLVEVMGEDLAATVDGYEEMQESDFELSQLEQNLVQQYEQAAVKDYSANVFGETWTESQLQLIENELSDEEYTQINHAIQKEKNAVLGNIYLELVKVRTQIANENGYDSYADYAYEIDYCRDYSTNDIKKLYKYVKKFFVPLSLNLSYNIGSVDVSTLKPIKDHDAQQVLEKLGAQMNNLAPELDYAFKQMVASGLYDIDSRPNKLGVGYTCTLDSYGVPFIFNSPYNTYQDYKDMVHEFGHFNNAFYKENHILSAEYTPLDVCEIHSQALELLFMQYSPEVYGEMAADAVNYVTVLHMIDAVIQGCLNDEFQVAVYENPQMTLDEINQTYKTISESYGYYYPEEETMDYSWVNIGHTFSSPMYYISYATSGLSSLDLWTQSLSNREAAIQKYLDITLDNNNLTYTQVVKDNDLKDIFKRSDMANLATDIANYMEVSSSFAESETMTIVIFALLIAIALVVLYTILMLRKERRKLAQIEKEQRELISK